MPRRLAPVVWALLALAACGSRQEQPESPRVTAQTPVAQEPARAATRPRIVVLGDSLTAGLGLPADAAYPALLQRKIDTLGLNYEVMNAGVSGDTSAGGLSRLDWALEGDVYLLELSWVLWLHSFSAV